MRGFCAPMHWSSWGIRRSPARGATNILSLIHILKWARKRARPLWKKVLQRVAVILIVFSLSLGSLMIISPSVRAAVVNWVTEWYETHITFRYLGTPTEDEMPEYTIGALPNGYAEVDSEREEWPDYICIVYRNEVSGKTIYFDYTRMTQGYVNDFEVNSDTATSSVLVNGMQGYLFQEKNWEHQRSSIAWIDSCLLYTSINAC